MLKRLLVVTLVAVGIWMVQSCAREQTLPPNEIDCTTVDQAANTYTLNIKAILDNNCAMSGCHNKLSASAGVNLSTYADSKAAFESNDVLCTVKQQGGCLPMPDGEPKLADSLITYMQCWAESGYTQ